MFLKPYGNDCPCHSGMRVGTELEGYGQAACDLLGSKGLIVSRGPGVWEVTLSLWG